MKSEEPFSLEEQLALTNDELKSNWVKLASLIRAYEKGTWDEAKAKASLLLKEKSADNYIDAVRAFPDGKPSEDPAALEPVKKLPDPASFNSIYEGNYKRLLKVAPGLDEILENPGKEKNLPQHGKSESSVYQDLHLDILDKERGGYHIALSHYYEQNGDMVADPDMRLLVDVKNKTVQALEFQNSLIYRKVYDDSYKRKMVDLREKNGQNKFLRDWLKNLLDQDHEIVWDEPEKEPEFDSVIIETVEKTEKDKPEPTSEPEETNITENMKKEEEKGKETKPGRKRIEPEKQVEKQKINGLEKSNYQKLLRVHAEFLSLLPRKYDKFNLVSNSPGLSSFEVVKMHDKNKMVKRHVVYEHAGEEQIGFLVIGTMDIRKLLIPLEIKDSFFGLPPYDEDKHSEDPSKKYTVNKNVEKWLDHLISKKYKVVEKEAPIIELKPEPPKAAEPKPEPKAEPKKQPADEVPDFEIGHVQLTDAHKRLGLKQKDINWINKHRQGMVLTPRKKSPINNTKNLLIDLSMQAKRPGCRISATGKIYYEGRSNRSDLTDAGL